eukprot:5859512-Pyramimonas_sp.AAC.1
MARSRWTSSLLWLPMLLGGSLVDGSLWFSSSGLTPAVKAPAGVMSISSRATPPLEPHDAEFEAMRSMVDGAEDLSHDHESWGDESSFTTQSKLRQEDSDTNAWRGANFVCYPHKCVPRFDNCANAH